VARLQRVFIETSELFPFTIMDVLLTLSEGFLFTWVWTDEFLDEWEKVIVREGKRTPESAASVAAAVRTHFSRYRIDPAVYRDKITDDLSPDPDDRMLAAAAIYGDVDVLLTRNLKHLRTKPVDTVIADTVSHLSCGNWLPPADSHSPSRGIPSSRPAGSRHGARRAPGGELSRPRRSAAGLRHVSADVPVRRREKWVVFQHVSADVPGIMVAGRLGRLGWLGRPFRRLGSSRR